jgi:hypothetical protein
VRKQKKDKKAASISKLKKREAIAASMSMSLTSPYKEAFQEPVLSYGLVSNGDTLADAPMEDTSPYPADQGYSAIKFTHKPKKAQNLIEVNAVIDEVRYRGYALELSCKVENTQEGGYSLIQVITNTKDPNWKKGDNLVLSIKKKDLRVLAPDDGASLDDGELMVKAPLVA